MASILIGAGGEATGDRALAVHGRVLLVASSRDLLLACGGGSEGEWEWGWEGWVSQMGWEGWVTGMGREESDG